MKNKLLHFILAAFAASTIITACNDDFSEEDLLRMQQDMANEQNDASRQKNLEALNEAGELLSFQLQLVNTDGAAVEGLSVELRTIDGGTSTAQTVTTGANGIAFFEGVVVGGNNINISGSGIVPVTLQADFGNLQEGVHYQIINDANGTTILPKAVTESAIVTVLGAASSTATVEGIVNIETDLTNSTPEVPQDLTLKADFNGNLVNGAETFGLSYFFGLNDETNTIGTATVDNATGEYSMTVPAGIEFNIVVPNIEASQRLAAGGMDDNDFEVPAYFDTEAFFGSDYNGQVSDIPVVPGARIVFNDPPAATGAGFTLSNFNRVVRDASTSHIFEDDGLDDEDDGIYTKFSSVGSGFTESPTVTVTDATGEDIFTQTWVEYAFTGFTVTNAGSGLPDDSISFNLVIDRVLSDFTDTADDTTTLLDQTWVSGVLRVAVGDDGDIDQADVNEAITNAIADRENWFDPEFLNDINTRAFNIRLISDEGATTEAILSLSSATSRLTRFVFEGDKLTNPTFAISGGGANANLPTIETNFASYWSFDLDNSGIEAYSAMPEDIGYSYTDYNSNGDIFTDFDEDVLVFDEVTVNDEFSNDIDDGNLINFLGLDDNGQVVSEVRSHIYITDRWSYTMPTAIVASPLEAIPYIGVITPDEIEDGSVMDIIIDEDGEGYTLTSGFSAEILPGAEGAPGTGASIELLDVSLSNDGNDFFWDGDIFLTGGTGFLPNLNVESSSSGADGDLTEITLQEGETFRFDIEYGTGYRPMDYKTSSIVEDHTDGPDLAITLD